MIVPAIAEAVPRRSRARHGTVSPEQVIEATARFFHSTADEITDYCRTRRIVTMRQIAMFLSVEAGNSLPVTGKAFGRDHTTVHHAHRTVERSKELKAQAIEIAMLLENGR